MKQALKITVLVMLFCAVIVGAIYGVRGYQERQTAAVPVVTEGQTYLTTSPDGQAGKTLAASEEKDDLKSDAAVEETSWPFSDKKSESKFEAKESVGYTVTKKAAAKDSGKTTKKAADDKTKAGKETTKAGKSDAGDVKTFLKNLDPSKPDADGAKCEYLKFAVADLNGDGKDEVFVYGKRTKDGTFYGYSYTVYSSDLKSSRTTMVVDEYQNVTFYKSGVYEITEGKFAFTSDAVASSFGVKNANSILGYDTTATPYLRYTTNGPYIDNPSEVSESDYKAAVSKLKAGGKVDVKVYDFTAANIEKL